jgi:hypothetical protein
MTGSNKRVAAAQPADMEPLVSVMVLAFAADPVARWMYSDPQRYLAHFGRFIRVFAGKAFSTGTHGSSTAISEVRCGFRRV